MTLLSADFLLALGAIVVIDLLLAGDNAIVIALAARNLPPDLQKRAILWGTLGAIAVRTLMTLVVVWLLRLPGLLLAGGVMLVWIAYQLLLSENGKEDGGAGNPADSFWAALRTVVVADVVMGLDNVLAVAGAANGSFLLVVLGLLISVPIMVCSSTLLLRYIERHPWLIYFGAGVLAWTAAKMISHEPLLEGLGPEGDFLPALFQLALVSAVLCAGFVGNHRQIETRIAARLVRLNANGAAKLSGSTNQGELTMLKVIVPVDGSGNSSKAVDHVIGEFCRNRGIEIHLLNVQAPLSRAISRFIGRRDRDDWHREQAENALRPLSKKLTAAGIPHTVHIETGPKAETIVGLAQRLGCDHIVIGTARKSSLTRMIESSVTNRVIGLTTIPVEVIAGEDISRIERYGIPAGIGGLLALLLVAAAD